jgi:hypothetical protein
MMQQLFRNFMDDYYARIMAEGRTDRITPNPELKAPNQPRPSGPDFIDSRDPNSYYTQDMVNYIDPATGERTSRTRGVVPGPGSRFVPENQAGMYGQRPPQGPQVGGGMGGGIPTPIPQAPQNAMATYNNLLQQGIQRSNTMNQDAASNFANMQAGAPTTQPAVPANLPNPTMSLGGTNTAKPKAPKPTQNFPNIRAF